MLVKGMFLLKLRLAGSRRKPTWLVWVMRKTAEAVEDIGRWAHTRLKLKPGVNKSRVKTWRCATDWVLRPGDRSRSAEYGRCEGAGRDPQAGRCSPYCKFPDSLTKVHWFMATLKHLKHRLCCSAAMSWGEASGNAAYCRSTVALGYDRNSSGRRF